MSDGLYRPNMASKDQLMGTFWLVAWAFAMALAWVLPNHYYPWAGFHMDVWMALILLGSFLWQSWKWRGVIQIAPLPLAACALMIVIAVQYSTGLLIQAGNAWVSAAYIFGFLLAWIAATRWTSASRWQLADGLFFAIGIAAFTSVGLQLHQLLRLDRLDVWSMGGGEGRPYANMGQPNQLGTLLMWGLLALLWGLERHRIGAKVAIAGSAFLLLGVAMTQSRAAWVGLSLLLLMLWLWRSRWVLKGIPWTATALGVYFAGCIFFVRWLPYAVGLQTGEGWADIASIGSASRPALWALFIDAVLHRPWFGYGWNQGGLAHVAMALNHPPLHEYFQHAHNIFIDLILWCGLPIGLMASLYLVWWMGSRAFKLKAPEDIVLWLLLLVIANHALLELPLYYAYFLLPVGLVMGILDQHLGTKPMLALGRKAALVLWAIAAGFVTILIRDYSNVEQMYLRVRFQWAGIHGVQIATPDVLLLTQWRDFFDAVQLDTSKVMSDNEIEWLEHTASLNANPGLFQLLALARLRRGESEEAVKTLNTMCSVVPQNTCETVKMRWTRQAQQEPALAEMGWPN